MTVTLYKNFKKKINSTKQPSGGAEKEVYLKDGCSIESPIFLIDGIDLDVNYVKFNNNYFYVNDIILSNNNIYEVHCSMDPLASHKAEILDTTAYVKYSQSRFNKWIPDERLSMTDEIETARGVGSEPVSEETAGSVILTIAGDGRSNDSTSAQCGLVSCWAVNPSNFDVIVNSFYSGSFSTEINQKIFGADPY